MGEIRSAVSEPVLECVTREETVCHTSYVTQYANIKVRISHNLLNLLISPSTKMLWNLVIKNSNKYTVLSQENLCEDVFEKKCRIELSEVSVNETVTTCRKPLQRVCKGKLGTLDSKVLTF